jgi:tryptophanyl-tRNA synthetase
VNNKSAPWNNRLSHHKNSAGGGAAFSSNLDPERKIIIGSRVKMAWNDSPHLTKTNRSENDSKPFSKERPLIFVGTDVSGELHLGHIALLAVARMISDSQGGQLVVSLNEAESICSRNSDLKKLFLNRDAIVRTLTENDCLVHSRAEDTALNLFALRIWRQIISNKSKYSALTKFYEEAPNPADTLSIIIMAAAPIFVSLRYHADSVLMVYGEDEHAHLEYIFSLYKTPWFKKEAVSALGVNPPQLNYLLIRLLPDIKNKFKMSKTRPGDAISLSQISDQTKFTSKIVDYLHDLIPIVASVKNSLNNTFLKIISEVIF